MHRITLSRWLGVALLFFLPAIARAADPELTEDLVQTRYTRGLQLLREGYDAQALRDLLWCYDEGMPAFPQYKVARTSVLISAIKRLADNYDAAQQAMVKRCADAERRLLAGEDAAVVEFVAWCDALNDERRMIKIFDQLPADDSRRHGFGVTAFRVFLSKRRYADALSALPFDSMMKVANSQVERFANSPRASPESRAAAVDGILDFIEVLAGAQETTGAQEMIAKLKAFSPTGETNRDIERRLKRASASSK